MVLYIGGRYNATHAVECRHDNRDCGVTGVRFFFQVADMLMTPTTPLYTMSQSLTKFTYFKNQLIKLNGICVYKFIVCIVFHCHVKIIV